MKFFIIILFSFSTVAEIKVKHMREADQCIICHTSKDSKEIHLKNGKKIGLDQVPEFCGQCHGVKLRDWRIGAHGKKIKNWGNETGQRVSCITCHNPHIPKFESIKAKPAPLIRKS